MNELAPVINEILFEEWMQRGRVHERRRARIMRWVFWTTVLGVMALALFQI